VSTFVLVHGLASNLRLWDGVRGELVAGGHRVVAVDLRGHGTSPKPDTGYDVPTVAADVAALISSLGLVQPVVAGQSWGGHVVLELAASWPSLVGAVALIDGGWTHASASLPWDEAAERFAPPRSEGRPLAEIEARIRADEDGWPPGAAEAMLACFEVREDGTVAPRLTFDRHMKVLRGLWEHRPALLYPRVQSPVLLVACDDGSRPVDAKRAAVAEAEAALRPRVPCRTVWMEAHHDVHLQHPDAVAELLAELAASCEPSGRDRAPGPSCARSS
jgi:pimeloyl-ACP methyl ester carboxylesterase